MTHYFWHQQSGIFPQSRLPLDMNDSMLSAPEFE